MVPQFTHIWKKIHFFKYFCYFFTLYLFFLRRAYDGIVLILIYVNVWRVKIYKALKLVQKLVKKLVKLVKLVHSLILKKIVYKINELIVLYFYVFILHIYIKLCFCNINKQIIFLQCQYINQFTAISVYIVIFSTHYMFYT